MKVSFVTLTPRAEQIMVKIARVSSSRKDKTEKPEGLINYLIANKHWSPFEHASLTLEIVTSKSIAIQYLRHRSFTFQEFSQRYAKVENLEPFELRKQAVKNRQSSTDEFNPRMDKGTLASMEIAYVLRSIKKLYEELLDKGVAKECARMILPMCTQTTLYMTGTIRSWIHMMELRDDPHAQKEAQLIAKEMKKIFIKKLPIISKARGYV